MHFLLSARVLLGYQYLSVLHEPFLVTENDGSWGNMDTAWFAVPKPGHFHSLKSSEHSTAVLMHLSTSVLHYAFTHHMTNGYE